MRSPVYLGRYRDIFLDHSLGKDFPIPESTVSEQSGQLIDCKSMAKKPSPERPRSPTGGSQATEDCLPTTLPVTAVWGIIKTKQHFQQITIANAVKATQLCLFPVSKGTRGNGHRRYAAQFRCQGARDCAPGSHTQVPEERHVSLIFYAELRQLT